MPWFTREVSSAVGLRLLLVTDWLFLFAAGCFVLGCGGRSSVQLLGSSRSRSLAAPMVVGSYCVVRTAVPSAWRMVLASM